MIAIIIIIIVIIIIIIIIFLKRLLVGLNCLSIVVIFFAKGQDNSNPALMRIPLGLLKLFWKITTGELDLEWKVTLISVWEKASLRTKQMPKK